MTRAVIDWKRVLYHNVKHRAELKLSRHLSNENPQRGKEMGSPSFGGFHARLDWSPVSLQAHVQQ